MSENEYKPTDLRMTDVFTAIADAPAMMWTCVECNVCGHAIEKLGSDWVCEENCRCLMIGCVPSVKQS